MFKENTIGSESDVVLNAPSFKLLSTEELELVNSHRYEVTYKRGETIFKQGSACTHIITFSTGLAKIYLEGYNKKNLIVRLVKPNEFIASPGLNNTDKHYYSISAVEKSCVSFIETSIFKSIFKRNHGFAESLMREIHRNYSKTLQKLINLNQKHRMGRIAEALIYLSDDIYGSDSFELTLTKKELADMTGMSTESSFRILRELDDEGKIFLEKKNIKILDKDFLIQMSEIG